VPTEGGTPVALAGGSYIEKVGFGGPQGAAVNGIVNVEFVSLTEIVVEPDAIGVIVSTFALMLSEEIKGFDNCAVRLPITFESWTF
jgi:hypothetical protein